MKHFHIINLFYSSFLPYLLTKICFLKARLKPRNSSDTIFGTELRALPIEMLCIFVTYCSKRFVEHRINRVLFSRVCRLVRDVQLSNTRASFG